MVQKFYNSIQYYLRLIENLRKRKWLIRSVIFFLSLTIFFSTSNALAQTNTATTTTKIDLVKGFSETEKIHNALYRTDGVDIVSTLESQALGAGQHLLVSLLGTESFEGSQALADDDTISPFAKKGVVGTISLAIDTALSNPVSLDVKSHLASEWIPGYDNSNYATYAATGYDYLYSLGISGLWELFRNLAYILFVVILIITGFMIMFRQKIGGQTAITLFNSIPNIVIGLVLVTFSFAIAGLVVNIGVLLTNIVKDWLGLGNQTIYMDGLFALFNPTTISGGAQNSGFGVVGGFFQTLFSGGFSSGAGWFADLITGALLAIVGGLMSIIVALILVFVYIGISIRIYITLLKAFLGIILSTILGPIQIALSVIPGNTAMRVNWFNDLLRNMLVFPIVFFMVNLPTVLNSQQFLADPTGMIVGDLSYRAGASAIEFIMGVLIPLVIYNLAAEVPKFLTDFIPQNSGRGAEAAMQGAMGNIKKIPFVGSFM